MGLQWSDALNTGIALVDQQHQELFSRINGLLEATSKGKGTDEVAKTLQFLEGYVITHFRAEEGLMATKGFPGLAAHKVLHDQFAQDLAEIKAKYIKDGSTSSLVIATQRRVIEWLRNHIGVEDKKFGVFMTQRG